MQLRNIPKVPEHHGSAEDHRCRVSAVGAHDILGDMPASGLKERVFLQESCTKLSMLKMTIGPRAGLTLPTLQPGTIPGPPTRAAPMFDTMAPYKFGMTMTSNCVGRATSCMELHDIHIIECAQFERMG